MFRLRTGCVVCVLAAFLAIAVHQGEAADSPPVPADWSKYPYVLYVKWNNANHVGLAISKQYVLVSSLIGPDLANFTLYNGNPKTMPAKIAKISAEGMLQMPNMGLVKTCSKLSSVSQGMALTPSKFFSRTVNTPATLLFFSKDLDLQYVNTTVQSMRTCDSLVRYDSLKFACTLKDLTPGSCSYFSDGSTWFSMPALLINDHPNGFIHAPGCNTTSLPATLTSATAYAMIQPIYANIMNLTGGAVDVP